jgi:Zinc finger, C2H2 type
MYVLSEEEYTRLKLLEKEDSTLTKAAVNEVDVFTDKEQKSGPNKDAIVDNAPLPLQPPQTLETRYNCKICDKSYKQKRDLRRHVKLVHGITPPTKAIIPKDVINLNKIKLTTKTTTKKKKKKQNLHLFDKVKKWMTMPG